MIGSTERVAVNVRFNPSERSLNVIAGGQRVFDADVHPIGRSLLGTGRQVPHLGIGSRAGQHTIDELIGGIRFIR